jgi:hypothetical protein
MLRITATNRIILEIGAAVALAPLAAAVIAAVRGVMALRRGDAANAAGPVPLLICLLAGWLATVFTIPFLSSEARVDSRSGLLALARAAQAGRWPSHSLQSIIDPARASPGFADLAELLAVETQTASGAGLDEVLFSGGGRIAGDRPPFAIFLGWSSHALSRDHCEIIVFFRPWTNLSGDDLWLHEYPDHSSDYVDIGASLPARRWRGGDLAWEVFRSAHGSEFTLYAGIRSGADLGPSVRMGHVTRCGQ